MKQSQVQFLYERYQLMSDEELYAIINSDDYEEEAKDIARQILNGDRAAYRQKLEAERRREQEAYDRQQTINLEAEQFAQQMEEKRSAQQRNPLYDDIHQIAGDVRFIRNFIIVSLIIAIVSMVISLIVSLVAVT